MKKNVSGIILGVVILLLAGIVCWWLLRTAPVQKPEAKTRSAKIVQTVQLKPGDYPVSVTAYGSVVPARQLVVRPEITGRLVELHPKLVPGGRIAQGEVLFTIDDADYRIALSEAKTALAEAQSEVDIEAGRQAVAQRELEQLQKDLPDSVINKSLVLRQPFKNRTQALLDRAAAAVAKAELDLKRVRFRAPFNAVVIEESVEAGQLASSSEDMATIVGSDAYWIQASVPLSKLSWVKLPQGRQAGADVEIEQSSSAGAPLKWSGKVVRLLGDLEEAGRQARVLVEVPNPLDANPTQPLLLGSYVKVDIDAGVLKNSLSIPRSALREGDRVWLVGPEKKLIIHDAEVLWRRENTVVIKNDIAADQALIVSSLSAPAPGMALAPEAIATEPQSK
ncbi:efflux RND transporter periplasmic adaptor subunit [Verrucomicrobiaceae bacterium 5K15]|uniref:Efflux RND transporter periplasmic adaptor subunit n=1 Tax=Oceaniferula flava TaxID=2800421 RepID=A0AAE2VBQ8_9BACT|nr:efflux RND transporter periplasmic adaptor subunit [Oceaniferula flavus]MBK1854790.1 efflux RND transporter periplasmic adaptor subunit [Oceaniferula flavus]MBM1136096.1 efflux RND transporter periplasmic adaptor subunit [Oceaniferula flavus]